MCASAPGYALLRRPRREVGLGSTCVAITSFERVR